MSDILDQFGRPIVREKVVELSGRAQSFPEKTHWQESIARGLTPARLAGVLRANDWGDNVEMQTLAIEMEERDLHFYSQLLTRINALAFVPWKAKLKAADKKNKFARKIAEECQEVVLNTPLWKWLVQDLMDAISKGYSVVQPVWDTTTRPWSFKSFEHIDARVFQFEREFKKELRIRVDDDPLGRPLPPGIFLVHYPRIRTGVTKLRGGIARLAAVNWFFKTTTVTDWLAFAEVYGMPIRIGTYNPATAGPEELATMRQALINLGHDASAMIPDGMNIEVIDARRPSSGENLYKGIVQYFDEQTSRALLGQVLASDARATGLGTAVADLQKAVRQDIREADAEACRYTLEALVRMWVQFNYGPAAPVPFLEPAIQPVEDLQAFTEGALPWFVQGGLKIGKQWLYDRLQVPVPEDGEETVSAPLAPGTPGAGPLPGQKSVKKTVAQP